MRFHNKLKSVDHWIASDGAGFMLVEGIFIPGTKARQVWFTVQSIIEKNWQGSVLHCEEWVGL